MMSKFWAWLKDLFKDAKVNLDLGDTPPEVSAVINDAPPPVITKPIEVKPVPTIKNTTKKLEKEMIEFLDKKLKNNGLAQQAIEMRDPRTLMVQAAQACVGIMEKGGNNSGPMVELIQETLGGHSKEAWCMAFVQTLIGYAEVKTGVKSPIFESEHCYTTWQKTPKDMRVKSNPLPGAIAIYKKKGSTNGHTGIVLGADDKYFQAVEGNTTSGSLDPDAPVVSDGGGVYFTKRSRKGYGNMELLGFLIPFPKLTGL